MTYFREHKCIIITIGFVFMMVLYSGLAYAWVDNNNINRSDIVDSDHMGIDWTVQDGTEIAGNHTNIGNFKIESGDRVYVKAYNGTNFGAVEIYADSITIDGILTANERGFGGGGGGGGSYGMGSWNGSRSMPVGSIGQGGTGTADGSNGNNAFEHWTSGHGNHTGFGGKGGNGGGSFGGAGGTQCTDYTWNGETGLTGARGGYAASSSNGDTTTDESLLIGSGGGGGAGGTSQRTGPSAGNSGADGSGGGGAGARGGGSIKLYATGLLKISGRVVANGGISAGNGAIGGQASGATGGNGGNGGSASSSGGRLGGAMTWEYPYGGYSGGNGGKGAGGGILLSAATIQFDGSGIIRSLGGYADVLNGGTVKMFYIYSNFITDNISSGRLYEVEDKIDIGYKIYDGTNNVTIACEPEGSSISPLSIRKSGKNYAVKLVDISHPKATKVKIQTPDGVKALQKY